MKIKTGFELVEVAGEYIAVPVGQRANLFKGVVALTDAGAFLFRYMKQDRSEEELLKKLIDEYDVTADTARKDVEGFLNKMLKLGLVENLNKEL